VRRFCTGRIAHYKVPRYVHLTEEFPITVTGEVQQCMMREAAIEMVGLQESADRLTA
jgi:fatty-acyl-CoA synthase